MDWLEVKIYTTTEGIEHVAGTLLMLGIEGLVIEDKSNYEELISQASPRWDYIDESLEKLKSIESSLTFYLKDDLPGREQIALIRSEIERLGRSSKEKLGRLEIEINGLKQSDWENGWKKYFKPFCVGKKFFIAPSWERPEDTFGRKELVIDPGMSFGTGQHHTTRLCIEALEKYVKDGSRVLDLGCGSGILSIASLLLGASEAVGIDIDPGAVRISKDNAALNGFNGDRYSAYSGDILGDKPLMEAVSGKYDIIVANIVADVLIAFAPIFKKYMSESTRLICSGIIDDRIDDIKKSFDLNGYDIIGINRESEWYQTEALLKGNAL